MGPLEKTQSVGIVWCRDDGLGHRTACRARRSPRRVVRPSREGASVSAKKRIRKRNRKDLWRAASSREKERWCTCPRSVAAGDTIGDLAGCGLVIEAIVEDLDVKRRLFAALEDIVSPEALLATNTSSHIGDGDRS